MYVIHRLFLKNRQVVRQTAPVTIRPKDTCFATYLRCALLTLDCSLLKKVVSALISLLSISMLANGSAVIIARLSLEESIVLKIALASLTTRAPSSILRICFRSLAYSTVKTSRLFSRHNLASSTQLNGSKVFRIFGLISSLKNFIFSLIIPCCYKSSNLAEKS